MDGMADYIRAPSRMFPDVSDFEAATGFLNSEKVRSLGLHHPHQHPFGGAIHPPHPHNPRLPSMPLATIQQHLFAIQQRTNSYPIMPSPSASSGGNGQSASAGNNNNHILPIPFPHHLLSQWTLAAAAGFGLNQLGFFGLGGLPGAGLPGSQPTSGNPSISPPQSSRPQSSPLATTSSPPSSLTGSVSHLVGLTGEREAAILKGQQSPSLRYQHRFSPYPTINMAGKMVTSGHGTDEPSERSPASVASKLTFDK